MKDLSEYEPLQDDELLAIPTIPLNTARQIVFFESKCTRRRIKLMPRAKQTGGSFLHKM